MKQKFDGKIVGLALAMTVASAALVSEAPVATGPTLAMGSSGGDSDERRAASRSVSASAAETAKILKLIRDEHHFCDEVPLQYRLSCLQTSLRDVARKLPQAGDYAEMRDILEDAGRRLDKVVRANADPSARPKRIAGQVDGRRIAKRLRPVDPAKARAANREAQAILKETETLLLRAAALQEIPTQDYRQIAAAVGSNKVLLRS